MPAAAILLALMAILFVQAADSRAVALVARYVQSLGGESTLLQSRTTEGEFDNGRGLKTTYLTYEQAPNKRATGLA